MYSVQHFFCLCIYTLIPSRYHLAAFLSPLAFKRGWLKNRVQIPSWRKINITIVRTLFSVSMASYQPNYIFFNQKPNFHFLNFFKNPKGGPFELKTPLPPRFFNAKGPPFRFLKKLRK